MIYSTQKLIPIFFLLLSAFMTANSPYPAITAVPVADLLGEPLAAINKAHGTHLTYQHLALCGKPVGTYACPRIHQLLFNEIVEVLDEKNGEVMIKIPNLFFVTAQGNRHQTYWTNAKNLIKLSALTTHGVNINLLPNPIHMQNSSPTQHIIVLTQPYYDPATKQLFSAGTRFVYAENKKDDVMVYALSVKQMRIQKISIPANICLDMSNKKTKKEKIKQFIDILRSWTLHKQGFIPYVWGGCSVVHLIPHHTPYEEKPVLVGTKKIGDVWEIASDHWPIKTGVDCAGLIARAAQLSGIPYFFKNSATVAQFLAVRSANEQPHSGDIMWLPGHVMVVGDVNKNTVIEARIYSHGYGKVHEIPLINVFEGIHNFTELNNALEKKIPLHRLGADGQVVQVVDNCKILALENAWDF